MSHPKPKAADAAGRVVAVCDVLGRIVAMRNVAAHQYVDLDPRRVWRILIIDVPALRAFLVGAVIPALSICWAIAPSGPRHSAAKPCR